MSKNKTLNPKPNTQWQEAGEDAISTPSTASLPTSAALSAVRAGAGNREKRVARHPSTQGGLGFRV